jgi:hypothetical protein
MELFEINCIVYRFIMLKGDVIRVYLDYDIIVIKNNV